MNTPASPSASPSASLPALAAAGARRRSWPARLLARTAVRVALSVLIGTLLVLFLQRLGMIRLLGAHVDELSGRRLDGWVAREAAGIDARLQVRREALQATAAALAGIDATPRAAGEALAGKPVLLLLFDRLFLAGADGSLLAAAPARAGERRQLGDLGLRAGVAEFQVGTPFQGADGRPMVAFAAPLPAAAGRPAPLLVGAMDLAGGRLFAGLRQNPAGDDSRLLIVGRDGRLLLHPDPARVLAPIDARAGDRFLHRALAGSFGWTVPAADPGGDLVAARPLAQAPWIVGAVMPAAAAHAPLRQMLALIAAGGAIGGLAIVLLVLLVTQWHLFPFVRLRQQVDAMRDGALRGRVTAGGAAEVTALADAFNGLLDSRRQIGAALAVREAFHRTLVDHSPLGLLLIEDGGHCVYANARAGQMTGRDPDELEGDGWQAAIGADDLAALRAAWHAARPDGAGFQQPLRLLRPDGTAAWTQVSAEALPGAQPPRYLLALLDISAERAALEASDLARRRMASVLDSVHDALLLLDAEGRVLDMTPVAEQLLGIGRARLIGRPADLAVKLVDEHGGSPSLAEITQRAAFGTDRWECCTDRGPRAVELLWRRLPLGAGAGGDGGLLTLRDIHQRREAVRAIEWAAAHDELTRLPNRRSFEQALRQAHALFAEEGVDTAVLMLDLDGFKAVNDRGGHDAGDEMLVAVAGVLRAELRQSDVSARLGGDEFGLLLGGCSELRAAAIADNIRSAIAELRVQRGDQQLAIGASLGVSGFRTDDAGPEAALRRADAAAYVAKRNGRDRVVVAESLDLPAAADAGADADAAAGAPPRPARRERRRRAA